MTQLVVLIRVCYMSVIFYTSFSAHENAHMNSSTGYGECQGCVMSACCDHAYGLCMSTNIELHSCRGVSS